MNKMSLPSRIIIGVSALALSAVYFLPVWFIFLLAPQYPEGLTMNIWLDKITGQVDIINGLNHYIGMKHISMEMFPEFTYLVYILGFFILFGLIVAIVGKRKLLFAYLLTLLAGALAAMYDFYQWGYDYGHNLDPKAAIQIPGLTYQPPLVGHKTLLNFDAYSYPDVGGWFVIVAGLIFFGVWIYEFRKSRVANTVRTPRSKKLVTGMAALLVISFSSCTTGPEAINYGTDQCQDCRMTIMEPQFGGELVTKKGRVFKFDDAHCLANYIRKGNIKEADIAQTVFVDYEKQGNFVDAASAYFVVSPQIKSPMNSNAAAFSNKAAASQKASATNGTLLSWSQLFASL